MVSGTSEVARQGPKGLLMMNLGVIHVFCQSVGDTENIGTCPVRDIAYVSKTLAVSCQFLAA